MFVESVSWYNNLESLNLQSIQMSYDHVAQVGEYSAFLSNPKLACLLHLPSSFDLFTRSSYFLGFVRSVSPLSERLIRSELLYFTSPTTQQQSVSQKLTPSFFYLLPSIRLPTLVVIVDLQLFSWQREMANRSPVTPENCCDCIRKRAKVPRAERCSGQNSFAP